MYGLRLLVALAFSCAVAVTSGLAATVQPLRGHVSLNQGKGFHPITGARTIVVGNLVMVSPNGSADVVYDDGCRVRISPGEVHSVSSESPCKAVAAPLVYTLGVVTGMSIGAAISQSGPKRPASP